MKLNLYLTKQQKVWIGSGRGGCLVFCDLHTDLVVVCPYTKLEMVCPTSTQSPNDLI